MGKRRIQLKTEKERGGEEMVEKQCTACRRTEKMEADIAFECWKINGGPFTAFDCPYCDPGIMIPKQVIEETEAKDEKRKTPRQTKRKKITDINTLFPSNVTRYKFQSNAKSCLFRQLLLSKETTCCSS